MARKKKLPAGMTQNMMYISEIEAEARKNGMHYGEFVASNNASLAHLSEEKRINQKACICRECGKEIVLVRERQRFICDECLKEREG